MAARASAQQLWCQLLGLLPVRQVMWIGAEGFPEDVGIEGEGFVDAYRYQHQDRADGEED